MPGMPSLEVFLLTTSALQLPSMQDKSWGRFAGTALASESSPNLSPTVTRQPSTFIGSATAYRHTDLKDEMKVVVSKDGPYLVSGNVPVSVQIIVPNDEGFSWDWKEGKSFATEPNYKLCRCGHSRDMPFCDDTHKTIDFDGEETAGRGSFMEEAKSYSGPALTLKDSEPLCAHARFCMAGEKIWNLVKSDDPESRELAIREAKHCPSGRLVVQDARTQEEVEHILYQSVGLVEDPAKGCSGPLWIRGGIRVESENGVPYEARNRVTLCRCGFSDNKPFCDGTHKRIRFKDGLMDF